MKCFMFNQWKLYANGELPPAASKGLEQHAVECPQCQIKLQEWVDHMLEEEFSTYPEVPVPDTFTDEVMRKLFEAAPARTARKRSSRTRRQRGWDIVKKTGLVVAGLTALVVTGTVVSPTFANYVNSLFQIEKDADNGMKNAVDKGFVQKLEQKVTDQGITFEAKEVMADSMRIAVIYDVYDQNGKQIKIGEDGHLLNAYLIDSTGKDWLEDDGPTLGGHGKYFIVEQPLNTIFESAEATPNMLTLKLEQTEIAGKKGKWSLEIPIDMKKAKEATKTVVFQDTAFHSPLGMEIELEKIEFSPSATRLMLETTLAKSAYVEVEREMEEVTLEGERSNITEKYKDPILSGNDIAYEITNEKGDVVAAWDNPFLDEGITKEKNVLRLMGAVGRSQGDYEMKWWHTFGPIQGEQKLKLQLKKIYEKKWASSKFDLAPAELNKRSATFKDETGSTFTFSAFSFESGSDNKPGVAVLTVEGTLGKDVVNTQSWDVKDENGQSHPVRLKTNSTRDKDGRVHVKGKLEIPRMEKRPKSLSVTYKEYAVEHPVNWEVPFEIK
ncbi:hypothetical protein BBR47_03900 [Brevibacillus brevis NBRC 100599]|uniref:DUF4179 domain-containing protein n=1 Tax=Brevibacillus brevis (strain 47 / JCM 6285 / NBRC 100599) TaxID=358681 RepID=C0ZJR6_BREBN|nr:DUF4179 domain-containing protein [Brevibacillus brevis]BAH41367.1 hypothetical protein BBR47_03900 [Brevibacillus brevis NBRC 100599]